MSVRRSLTAAAGRPIGADQLARAAVDAVRKNKPPVAGTRRAPTATAKTPAERRWEADAETMVAEVPIAESAETVPSGPD